MDTTPNETKARPAPEPGPFGRFYLQELISFGGMAEVWLATDSNQKAFALRRMVDVSRFSFGPRARFQHGCDVLRAITGHPGIVGYVEHGKIDGRLYCLMQYLEADNLKDVYGRQDPVLGENIAQILIDMAEGLEHMHAKGYMHLDYKPENILITRNGGVRLIDFDLAQPIPPKPVKFTKTNPGTPSYMAPEQIQGLPLSHTADIFSFGVTAYELLTNQKPFPGANPGEILSKMRNRDEFVPPTFLNSEIPENLEKVILRCLELRPEDRHPLISVMVRDLKAALYVQP